MGVIKDPCASVLAEKSRLTARSMESEVYSKSKVQTRDDPGYSPVTGMITHDDTNFYLMICNLAHSSNSFDIDRSPSNRSGGIPSKN